MHTVPALDHWPPVPPPAPRRRRRRSSVEICAEFTASGESCRATGRGATISDAILAARTALPSRADWRLARFFPVATAA
jgi:hypothetical protein